jgi:hypothetical protein
MLGDGHSIALCRVWSNGSIDLAMVFARSTSDDCQIFFLDLIVLELGREVALGGDIFGEEHDAAGILVEAVNQAKTRVGGAGAGDAELAGEHLQKAIVLRATRDAGKVGRFCHRYYLRVVIEDYQFRISDRKSPVDVVLLQFYYESTCSIIRLVSGPPK